MKAQKILFKGLLKVTFISLFLSPLIVSQLACSAFINQQESNSNDVIWKDNFPKDSSSLKENNHDSSIKIVDLSKLDFNNHLEISKTIDKFSPFLDGEMIPNFLFSKTSHSVVVLQKSWLSKYRLFASSWETFKLRFENKKLSLQEINLLKGFQNRIEKNILGKEYQKELNEDDFDAESPYEYFVSYKQTSEFLLTLLDSDYLYDDTKEDNEYTPLTFLMGDQLFDFLKEQINILSVHYLNNYFKKEINHDESKLLLKIKELWALLFCFLKSDMQFLTSHWKELKIINFSALFLKKRIVSLNTIQDLKQLLNLLDFSSSEILNYALLYALMHQSLETVRILKPQVTTSLEKIEDFFAKQH